MSEKSRCLTPGCTSSPKCRGVCQACYSAARLRVASNLNTWKELEAAGLVLESKAPEHGAFAEALKKQLGVEKKERKRYKEVVREAAVAPLRVIEQAPTMEDIRALALKVATNPSAEAMEQLIKMQARMKVVVDVPPPKPKREDSFKGVPLVYEEKLDRPEEETLLGPLPTVIESADGNSAAIDPVDPLVLPRLKDSAPLPKKIVCESTPNGSEPPMSLRDRSLADARAAVRGEPPIVEDGGCDQDGMSNEEFERILNSINVNDREVVASTPPLPITNEQFIQHQKDIGNPMMSSMRPPSPPPEFPEPDMPEDIEYDSALDGPSESATGFVPINPIQQ